jgi:transposase
MSKKKRRHFTPEQKASILKKHLFDKEPISRVSEEHQLQPSQIYDWQNQAKVNLSRVFVDPNHGSSRRERDLEEKLAAAHARLATKDAVIAEVTEEFVRLKKKRGEP